MLLTRHNMNLTHFASRKRYIKDPDTGEVVETRYDRLLIGLRVEGREWLESHYADTERVVTVFMLGDKNVIFTYGKNDRVMYVNRNAGAQAMEYAHYWATHNDCEMEFVNDLPTAVKARPQVTRTAKTMEDLLDATAIESRIDCGL